MIHGFSRFGAFGLAPFCLPRLGVVEETLIKYLSEIKDIADEMDEDHKNK